MKTYQIALIPGDGIGPEQTEATLEVLDAVQERFNLKLNFAKVEAGDECLRLRGSALPEDSIEIIKSSHACLKGPVGETAMDVVVRLRLMFDLYANIRPVKSYPNVPCVRSDIDFIFARENTEDVYKGIEFMLPNAAVGLRVITRQGCERIARYAFELARRRNGKKRVTSVHKSNVMKVTDGLFAEVCREVAKRYPDIKFDELYVDAAAMQLIRAPQEFDVVLTPNMFGDILSDEAAQLVGGLGMAPGANIGDNFAVFEPVHGSAPSLAGKHIANPCSMILATKLMLNWIGHQFRDPKCIPAAETLENAVVKTLSEGSTTPDLGGKMKTGEVGTAIAEKIKRKGAL